MSVCTRYFSIAMFFLTGAFVPVLNNIILKFEFSWKYGFQMTFKKPWFQNFANFAGMSLFGFNLLASCSKKNENSYGNTLSKWNIFRSSAIPSILYIISSVLQTYSLLYMPIVVWQAFHGFQVLFTSVLTMVFFKRRLYLVDWLGLFVTVSGICFTGVASLLRGIGKSDTDITKLFFVLMLAIFSHLVRSIQNVLEEEIMKDTGLRPSHLTAYEGLWGLYISSMICLPLCQLSPSASSYGLYENSLESIEMLQNSAFLRWLLVSYVVAVTLFAYFGILVTSESSAIHRNLYETIRPLFVWLLSLLAQYELHSVKVGEELDKYTILELVGFFVSFIGSLIFNRFLRFGCLLYVDDHEELNSSSSTIERSLLVSNPGDIERDLGKIEILE